MLSIVPGFYHCEPKLWGTEAGSEALSCRATVADRLLHHLMHMSVLNPYAQDAEEQEHFLAMTGIRTYLAQRRAEHCIEQLNRGLVLADLFHRRPGHVIFQPVGTDEFMRRLSAPFCRREHREVEDLFTPFVEVIDLARLALELALCPVQLLVTGRRSKDRFSLLPERLHLLGDHLEFGMHHIAQHLIGLFYLPCQIDQFRGRGHAADRVWSGVIPILMIISAVFPQAFIRHSSLNYRHELILISSF